MATTDSADIRSLAEVDLDNRPKTNYEDGFRDGREKAMEEALTEERQKGFKIGRKEGKDASKLQKKNDAFKIGREQGELEGRVQGAMEAVKDVQALQELLEILPFMADALEEYSESRGERARTPELLRLRSVLPRLLSLGKAKLLEDAYAKADNLPFLNLREINMAEAIILDGVIESMGNDSGQVMLQLGNLLPEIREIAAAEDEVGRYAVDISTADVDLRGLTGEEALALYTAYSTHPAETPFTRQLKFILGELRSYAATLAAHNVQRTPAPHGPGQIVAPGQPNDNLSNTASAKDADHEMPDVQASSADTSTTTTRPGLTGDNDDDIAQAMQFLNLRDLTEHEVELLPDDVQIHFWKSRFKAIEPERRTKAVLKPFKSPMPDNDRIQRSLANRELGGIGYDRSLLVTGAEEGVRRLTPLKHGRIDDIDELTAESERLEKEPRFGTQQTEPEPPQKKTRVTAETDPRNQIIASHADEILKLRDEIVARKRESRKLILVLKTVRDNLVQVIDAFTIVSNSSFAEAAQECSRRIRTWWLRNLPDSDLARLLCDCGAKDPSLAFRLQIQSTLSDLPETMRFLQRIDVESFREMMSQLPQSQQNLDAMAGMDLASFRSRTVDNQKVDRAPEGGQTGGGLPHSKPCYTCKCNAERFASGDMLVACSLELKDNGVEACVKCFKDAQAECRILCDACELLPLEQVEQDCQNCQRRSMPVAPTGVHDDDDDDDDDDGAPKDDRRSTDRDGDFGMRDVTNSTGKQPASGATGGRPGLPPTFKFRKHPTSKDREDNDALDETQQLPFKHTKYTKHLFRSTNELIEEVVKTAIAFRKSRRNDNTRSQAEKSIRDLYAGLMDMHTRTDLRNVLDAANELNARAMRDLKLPSLANSAPALPATTSSAPPPSRPPPNGNPPTHTSAPPKPQQQTALPGSTSQQPPGPPGSSNARAPPPGVHTLPYVIPGMGITWIPSAAELQEFLLDHTAASGAPPRVGHVPLHILADLYDMLAALKKTKNKGPDLHPLSQVLGHDNIDVRTGKVSVGFRLRGG
ncbi:hypothetical protein LTR27_009955 [Elasticomyces elasticus]|nr:hypothetical protein LTR27_009955 [Elasticomyces elasticus]